MTALSKELVEAPKIRNVSPICGEAVDAYWEHVWGLFQELPLWTRLFDESTTYQQVKMGALQVWAYSDSEIRGIMVTRINIFPKVKVLDVVGISGISGVEYLQNLDDVCEHLARQEGCTYLSCAARPGMQRLLERRHRAAHSYSVLVRPVGLLRSS